MGFNVLTMLDQLVVTIVDGVLGFKAIKCNTGAST